MLKNIFSIVFNVALELIVFAVVMSKTYDSDTELVIICIFLLSIPIRSQISGVGIVSMISPSFALDMEKDKKGEQIDRKPYEKMTSDLLETQVRFAILGVVYFGMLLMS